MLSQAALFNILAVLYIFLIQIRHSKNTNIDYNCYPRKVCASQRGVWLRALLVGVESDSAAECSRLFWSNLRCVCMPAQSSLFHEYLRKHKLICKTIFWPVNHD